MNITTDINTLNGVQTEYNIKQEDKGQITSIVLTIINFISFLIVLLGLLSHPLAREEVRIEFLTPFTSFVLAQYPDNQILNVYGIVSVDKFITIVTIGIVLTVLISLFLTGLIIRRDISQLIATEHVLKITNGDSIRKTSPKIHQTDGGDIVLQFNSGRNWVEINGFTNEIIQQNDELQKHRVLITQIKELQTRQGLTDYGQADKQTEPIESYEFVDRIGLQIFPQQRSGE
jgi:hypothetical protein